MLWLNPEQVSERQPHRILGAGLVGVAMGDTRGNVVAANDAFLGIHGYTRDDMRAKAIDWTGLSAPE
jgi:PAS domain-containing protein